MTGADSDVSFSTSASSAGTEPFSGHTTKPGLFHWRTSGGAEVDFVLDFNGTLFPIEVKAKSHPTLLDLRGIKSFRETYPRRRIGKGLIIDTTISSFPGHGCNRGFPGSSI